MGYVDYKVINFVNYLEDVVRDENSLPIDPSDPVDRLLSGEDIVLRGGVVA